MQIKDTYYWQQKKLAVEAAKLRREIENKILKPICMPIIEFLSKYIN